MIETPACAGECRELLLLSYRDMGLDVRASWQPPLLPQRYEDLNMTCPHGVRWYAWPTVEQRKRWAEEGVQ